MCCVYLPTYVCTVYAYFLCIKVQGIVAMHQVQGDGSAESVSSSMGVSPMFVPPSIHLHIRIYIYTYSIYVCMYSACIYCLFKLYIWYVLYIHTDIHVYLMFILYIHMHKLKVCMLVCTYVCTVRWYF